MARLPKSDGQEVVEIYNGFTDDIEKSILDCYYDTFKQTESFVCDMVGNNDVETCLNIAKWIDEHIEYVEDPIGKQWIKTPARFVDDGEGDCKSFAIFINSCLANCGIENIFRFVAYKGNEHTHVYSVAIINGKEYPIDITARKIKGLPYFSELKYKTKRDMRGTTISRLSGIEAEESTITMDTDFYTGDGDYKKVNEIYLLSEIDMLNEYANIETDEAKLQNLYNKMDFLQACLKALNFAERIDLMEIVGMLIAKYSNDGVFDNDFSDMNERAKNLDNIVSSLRSDFERLSSPASNEIVTFTDEFRAINKDFLDWWNKKIIARNYVPEDADISGIGAIDKATLIKTIAPTLIYATQNYDMDSAKAKLKQKRENKLIQYISKTNPDFDVDTIKNIVESGVVATFNRSPLDVINILKQGNKKSKISGIGLPTFDTSGNYNLGVDASSAFSTPSYNVESIANTMMNKSSASATLTAGLNIPDFANSLKTMNTTAQTTAVAEEKKKLSWIDYMTGVTDALKSTADTINSVLDHVTPLVKQTESQIANSTSFRGITPNTDDWTSSPVVLAVGAGLLGFGVYTLAKKPKKKK
jgi:hypothetical protein